MAKKRPGRPPAGVDAAGKPLPTSAYPQVSVRIATNAKDLLDCLSRVEGASQGEVIARALESYAKSLPAAMRKALDAIRELPRRRD